MAAEERYTPPLPQPNVAMSEEALTRILTAAVRAGTAPSAEEAAKVEQEKARLLNRRKTMIRLAQVEEREKARKQANCDHKKPDGTFAIGGQEMSNSRDVKICLRCQKVIMDRPTQEMSLAQAEMQRLADTGRLTIKDGKVQIHETAGV